MLDRFECYELCVQSPRHVVSLLRGIALARGGVEPIVLREDFCGTAAVSRRWCAEDPGARAIAIDMDAEAVGRADREASLAGVGARVRVRLGDAVRDAPAADEPADVVWVGNFSIGYIHDRRTLVEYLRASRGRLSRGNAGFGGGVFACDTYGGAGAYALGGLERRHPSRGREVVRYSWVHERADPLTGMVENSISFRVEVDGEVVGELPRAFSYRWRLWGIHELREAMTEAGFETTSVYAELNVAPGEEPRAVEDPAELGKDWIVVVAGW